MSDRSLEADSSGNLTGLGNPTKAVTPSYFSIVASRWVLLLFPPYTSHEKQAVERFLGLLSPLAG